MIALEEALRDVGEHLDHPAGDGLAASVRSAIDAQDHVASRQERAGGRPWLIAAAVAAALIVAGTAYGPTRTAVADWLGIGTVEVKRDDRPASPEGADPVPGAPGDAPGRLTLDEAQAVVDFPIALPADDDELRGVAVDARVPGGLVALDFGAFTLVEIASAPGAEPWVAKTVPEESRIVAVLVGEAPGLWIGGLPHEVGYYDREGNQRSDTLRRSGPVLLWERDGVTYRIEGFTEADAALAVAEAVG